MKNPADLVTAVAGKIAAIPELSGYTVTGYVDGTGPNLNDAIQQLALDQILVAWRRTYPSGSSSELWRHEIGIYLLVFPVFPLIANGVPDGESLNFRLCSIDPSVYAVGSMQCGRSALQISDTSYIEYFEAVITLTEKGDA